MSSQEPGRPVDLVALVRQLLGAPAAYQWLTPEELGTLIVAGVGRGRVALAEVQRFAEQLVTVRPSILDDGQRWVSKALAAGCVRLIRGRLEAEPKAVVEALVRGHGGVGRVSPPPRTAPRASARVTPRAAARVAPRAVGPAPARTDARTTRAAAGAVGSAAARGAASPRPNPPVPAALPAPPPWEPAVRQFTALDPSDVVARLSVAPVRMADVEHTLAAHALASAGAFDELLSLSTLNGVTSHRYQVETVRRVLRSLGGRALLADEVGLGKTIEAIIALREYQLRQMARRILVLTPAALVHHWVGELAAKAGVAATSTDDPRVQRDPDGFWATDGIVVASLGTARTARHAPLVAAQAWDLVIVDEAHHIKRRTSLGWKLVDALRSRFLLLLTATPIESDLDEIYSLVTLLRPGHFATATAFRAQFVDAKNPTSPRNREQLRALLGQVMIRNTRAGCGLGLPPRFVTTYSVDPLPEERALYDAVLEFVRRSGDASRRRLANILLLEAGSSPPAVVGTLERALAARRGPGVGADPTEGDTSEVRALLDTARAVADSRKRGALLEILGMHPGEQVLVFTRYRNTAAYVAQALASAAIDHVVFEGGLSAPERARVLDAFAGGTRVMVATDVGGEGQNLQFCHVLVDFDLPWNPMLVEQRIGRLHRMGQASEVRVYNLCTRGTIDDRLLDVLDRRLHLFELVVGEMDMVLGNLADERDLEERVLALAASTADPIELERGFAAIEQELRAARTGYERSRALDDALFGEDFES